MLGVVFLVFFFLFLCLPVTLWLQWSMDCSVNWEYKSQTSFSRFQDPAQLLPQEISYRKVCQVSWCCVNVEGFKDVLFTSWWYWGRVSLPPSLTKQQTNTHISTIFLLIRLFVSAEEDTKQTSHVQPWTLEGCSGLGLFSVYVVPKPWTGAVNFMGYSESSSCFQRWGHNGSSSLSLCTETKWSIMSECSASLPWHGKGAWCRQPIPAEGHR